MSKSVMIALLEQGNTGTEILSILDSFIQEQESNNQPTSEPIEF